MKFERALDEKVIPIKGATRAGKRFRHKMKVGILAFNEQGKPLDVMRGLPPGFEFYGRGGWTPDGTLWVRGGGRGDPNGAHSSGTRHGFYWGIDYDAKDFDGQNVLYIRGKDQQGNEFISKHILSIIAEINKIL